MTSGCSITANLPLTAIQWWHLYQVFWNCLRVLVCTRWPCCLELTWRHPTGHRHFASHNFSQKLYCIAPYLTQTVFMFVGDIKKNSNYALSKGFLVVMWLPLKMLWTEVQYPYSVLLRWSVLSFGIIVYCNCKRLRFLLYIFWIIH